MRIAVALPTFALALMAFVAGAASPVLAAAPVAVTAKTMKIAPPAKGVSLKRAVVEIVEFSDFQCPFCARATPTLDKLLAKYPKDVRLVFRHLPLAFHKNARMAAAAAIASGDKFWEFHDQIWELKRGWGLSDLETIARNLGLNISKWRAAMNSNKVASIIARDEQIAKVTGNRGTPSFMINGQPLRGAQPLDRFVAVVEKERAASSKKGKKGRGKKWISSRTKKANRVLWDYTYGRKIPKITGKAARVASKPKPVDETVWRVDVDHKRDGSTGPENALVTIVEFGDFQCPFCERLRHNLELLKSKYGRKVRLIFRHNPLSFHKEADRAAEASLCAKEQGAFWSMHDTLFDNIKSLKPGNMSSLAAKAGVSDIAAFDECFNDRRYKAQVTADKGAALRAGARGTPNTFVNGRKITGAKPLAELRALVDEELAKAKKLLRSGVKRSAIYAHIQKGAKEEGPFELTKYPLTAGNAASTGDPDKAPVVITAFLGFQCPYCRRLFPLLEQVSNKRPGKIAVVFRHFPLSFHKQGKPAAVAAECAHRQGRFWEMAKALFEGDASTWNAMAFEDMARDAGVTDLPVFASCLDATGPGSAVAAVEADRALGRKSSVRGTPSLYINGRKWKSANGYTLANLERDLLVAGIGQPKPLSKAKAKAKIAAAKAECDKDPLLCTAYGRALESHGTANAKRVLAASAFRRGCDAGDPAACVLIARRTRTGNGVKVDLESARRDMERACKLSAGKVGCENQP